MYLAVNNIKILYILFKLWHLFGDVLVRSHTAKDIPATVI